MHISLNIELISIPINNQLKRPSLDWEKNPDAFVRQWEWPGICWVLLTWAAVLLDSHHGRAECGGRRGVGRRREGPLGDTRWAAGMGRTPIHGHLTLKDTQENNELQNSPQCWIMGNGVNLRALTWGSLWGGETYRTTSISAPRRNCQFTKMTSGSSQTYKNIFAKQWR